MWCFKVSTPARDEKRMDQQGGCCGDVYESNSHQYIFFFVLLLLFCVLVVFVSCVVVCAAYVWPCRFCLACSVHEYRTLHAVRMFAYENRITTLPETFVVCDARPAGRIVAFSWGGCFVCMMCNVCFVFLVSFHLFPLSVCG